MAEKTIRKTNLYLWKRDFDRGQNETLGLPMDQVVVQFPNATEDDPANRNKYNHFIVHFTPDSGVWKGGTFSLSFDWGHDTDSPVQWPMHPMNAKCLTKIWHPNIDVDGKICHGLVYLHPNAGGMHPNGAFTSTIFMQFIVQGLLTLFFMPNFEDPLNRDAGAQGAMDLEAFNEQARDWTRQYASATPDVPIYQQPLTGTDAPAAHLA